VADLKITELPALPGASIAADDVAPVADVSASETKKVTVGDLFTQGLSTFTSDNSIPGAKLVSGSVTATQLGTGSVGASALADNSVDTAALQVGSVSGASGTKATIVAGSIGPADLASASVTSAKLASSAVTTAAIQDSAVTNAKLAGSIDTSKLASTSAASQFLAGPTTGAGAITARTLQGIDLPTATSSTKGAIIVNGEGLRLDSSTLEIDNDVTLSSTAHVVTYNAKGLVTSGRLIQNADLPVAVAGTKGAVSPGTGLSVDGAGVLNHTNTVTAGTATKITFDAQGHVTAGVNLTASDIPNLSASQITTGTLASGLFGTNSITGAKIADSATVQFGGAGSTAGVVTFPIPEYKGQYFYDELNGDLYLWNGNAWTPITITAGELIYAGTYNASTNTVASVTAAGTAAGLVVSAALPAASANNLRYYVVVSVSGTGTSPAPAVALAPPDMLVSGGTSWELVDVSSGIGGQIASNITFTPYGGIAATNVQTALQELEDEKLPKVGGTITGELLIGTAGSLVFEGSTADAYETTLAVTDPTVDRTITLPNQSGNVLVSGNASIVDADISASAEIAVSKLADGTARQLLQTDAAGTGVEWTSNVDIPGTLDVTGTATFDGTVNISDGTY
jgi:hypothetical protein